MKYRVVYVRVVWVFCAKTLPLLTLSLKRYLTLCLAHMNDTFGRMLYAIWILLLGC